MIETLSLQTIDGITKIVFTLSVSLASVAFGAHLASVVTPQIPALPPPNRFIRRLLTWLSIFAYAAAFVAYFRLSPMFRHQATAALLFSYPGTLTRYFLSIRLNPVHHTIPLGTFVANISGTALLG